MKDKNEDNFQTWLNEQSRPKKILLVEDNPADIQLIKTFTARFNCEWVVANSYAEATSHCQCNDYKLVFLDLKLGTIKEGVDTFRWLVNQCQDVPVIVLSGHLTEEAIREITSIGFALFAEKTASLTERHFAHLFRVLNIPVRPNLEGMAS